MYTESAIKYRRKYTNKSISQLTWYVSKHVFIYRKLTKKGGRKKRKETFDTEISLNPIINHNESRRQSNSNNHLGMFIQTTKGKRERNGYIGKGSHWRLPAQGGIKQTSTSQWQPKERRTGKGRVPMNAMSKALRKHGHCITPQDRNPKKRKR